MKNFIALTQALCYIEEHLCDPLSRTELASHCYISLSSLEKLFRYAIRLGVSDYIQRRRMTQAARDLSKRRASVTQTAMKYQFNSVEVFSRAFRRVWNVNPSEFNDHWRFTGLFPKLNYRYQEGDDLTMARKNVDFSESFDYLRAHAGAYVLCFDMQHLMEINHISHRAGDLAILEMASRLDRSAGEEMLTLRIGGDEFALITDLTDEAQARELAGTILAQNGTPILFEGREIPISLWCGLIRLPESLRFGELFHQMQRAIDESKQ